MTTKTTFPPKRRSYEPGDCVVFRGEYFGVVTARTGAALTVHTVGERWNQPMPVSVSTCRPVSQYVFRAEAASD